MNSFAALKNLRSCLLAIGVLGSALAAIPGQAWAQATGETREIVYLGDEAQSLREQAATLGTPVAIYEHLRNNTEFVPYWGSTSGSVNAYMGRLGNDVDLASALIAMLRSRGIPARYAVATIRMPNAQVLNWLGVGTPEVAKALLDNSGIPAVTRTSSNTTLDFEHAWVQVQLPFDQYRGLPIDGSSIDCNTTPEQCAWVPLDPSFKQKIYNGLNLDPFPEVAWDDADYTKYHDAILDNDTRRKDKNPLAILEQDVLDWLHADPSRQGKTIEDVLDKGQVIEAHEGLLPASLPYLLIGTPRVYDSVEAHDASTAETNKWGRTVTITTTPCNPATYTGATSQKFWLSELATNRLILTHSAGTNGTINLDLKLGRSPNAEIIKTWNFGTVTCPGSEGTKTFALGTPFYLKLETDALPDYPGTAFPPAIYTAKVGSRYLVAIGGEHSNWSQVHRAAEYLLASSQNYKIVHDAAHPLNGQTCDVASGTGCLPFVDIGPAGWDSGDPLLTDTPDATDALTGGLLEVAAAQYYAQWRVNNKRADGLMKINTPIYRLLGVIQSNYDVQYLQDSTAFSIQPNGLIIDMKGLLSGSSLRSNETLTTQNSTHFLFQGYVGSSLEHEIWQELTGFDAVSTVRGFQLARAASSPFKTYIHDAGINDAASFLTDMGFTDSVPLPFAVSVRDIYGTKPTSWSHPSEDSSASFDLLKRTPSSKTDTRIGPYTYRNDTNAGFFKKMDECENGILTTPASSPWTPYSSTGISISTPGEKCFLNFPSTGNYALSAIRTAVSGVYTGWRNNSGGNNYLNVFGEPGFLNTNYVYRTTAIGADKYSTSFVFQQWNDLYFYDTSTGSVQYQLTTAPASDQSYLTEVFLRKKFDLNGSLLGFTFGISVVPK
ncbi:MAG: transglutaminase-like domain-containing protein [Pseudomonadota bacterium]|nr:transglutaminase-like domain-containing protein [Pseudomonadota bacterium]